MKKVARGCVIVIGLLVTVIAGALGLYWLSYPTYTFRYRLSVVVDTPNGMRSGSSVIEVELSTFPSIGGCSEVLHVSGEAVFLDLGDGRNLVALLASGPNGKYVSYSGYLVFDAFNLNIDDEKTRRALSRLRGTRDVYFPQSNTPDARKERLVPTFVTFGDSRDLKTVRFVEPSQINEVLGPGVNLRSVSIEMTGDPVTHNIQATLPWLPHPHYFNETVGCGPGDPYHCLNGGHFMRSW